MTKVAIIGTQGVPARYGGFETLAHQLVLHLATRFSISVYCSGRFYAKQERARAWSGAQLHYLPLSAHGVQSVIYDAVAMASAVRAFTTGTASKGSQVWSNRS